MTGESQSLELTAAEEQESASSGGLLVSDLWQLTKPKITRMNVLMTLGGLALAGAPFKSGLIFWTALGTALAVASANALNMYIERDLDRLMVRTAKRPLPTRRMAPHAALWFGLVLGLLSLALLFVAVNTVTTVIAGVAIALYVLVYTPMKRTSPLALLVGAVPGAAPPLMGWTAVTNEITAGGLALFGILFCWQFTHFLAISLYLKEDYGKADIQTYSLVHGENRTKIMISMSMVLLIPATLVLVPMGLATSSYGIAASFLGFLLLGFSLMGFMTPKTGRWARSMFLATVAYLPLLFTALILGAGEA